MDSLSLQKIPQNLYGKNLVFPSIGANRDAQTSAPLFFPNSSFFKKSEAKKTLNSLKLPMNSFAEDFSVSSSTTSYPKFKENACKERFKKNECILAPPQKRKRSQIVNDFSQEDYLSPKHPRVKALQGSLLDLTRTDSESRKSSKFEEWHTPQKKLHVFWDHHENEKQAKLSELKHHLFETEYSRLTNDYKILEVLGRGSFGKVYRCINRIDKNEYAIKETFRSFTGKNKVYGLNETQALASLTAFEDNTNVVRYFNSWIEDDRLYLVMEFCPSSLKEERKQRGKFTESAVRKTLRDVCLGLAYLHRHSIAHLDIKPENILVSKSMRYKIGDMGQSRVVKRAGDIEEGDSRYVAPELLNCDDCEDEIDLKKCDIFSLGMTAFELLTDHNAPPNGDEWHQLRNGKLDLLEAIPGISERLKMLIRKMLSKNPFERPSAQELLAHDLPSEMEVELKWEKIQNRVLQERKTVLENQLNTRRKRRNSVA